MKIWPPFLFYRLSCLRIQKLRHIYSYHPFKKLENGGKKGVAVGFGMSSEWTIGADSHYARQVRRRLTLHRSCVVRSAALAQSSCRHSPAGRTRTSHWSLKDTLGQLESWFKRRQMTAGADYATSAMMKSSEFGFFPKGTGGAAVALLDVEESVTPPPINSVDSLRRRATIAGRVAC
jgi:hypothetical protein